MRDILYPLAVGCVLNSINLYEVGLNVVPVLRKVLAPTMSVSLAYFETGVWGCLLVSTCLGLIATRPLMAWAMFFLPTFLARVTTGTVLFFRGEANMWPIFFVLDNLLGLVSFALIYGMAKLRRAPCI